MILLINICKISFHYFEFVKPIEDILKKLNIEFLTINYNDVNSEMLLKSDKAIISGTSLKDNSFLDNIERFYWIKEFNKPVLGICGGMHILGLIYNGKLTDFQEILEPMELRYLLRQLYVVLRLFLEMYFNL